jgi:hypothetical protein
VNKHYQKVHVSGPQQEQVDYNENCSKLDRLVSIMNRELIKALIIALWGTLLMWFIANYFDKGITVTAPVINVTPKMNEHNEQNKRALNE